jgi:hypothetical protein
VPGRGPRSAVGPWFRRVLARPMRARDEKGGGLVRSQFARACRSRMEHDSSSPLLHSGATSGVRDGHAARDGGCFT